MSARLLARNSPDVARGLPHEVHLGLIPRAPEFDQSGGELGFGDDAVLIIVHVGEDHEEVSASGTEGGVGHLVARACGGSEVPAALYMHGALTNRIELLFAMVSTLSNTPALFASSICFSLAIWIYLRVRME
jgi:hypothetical protein